MSEKLLEREKSPCGCGCDSHKDLKTLHTNHENIKQEEACCASHDHKHNHDTDCSCGSHHKEIDLEKCGCGHDHSHEHKHEHKKQINSLTDSISCGCCHDHSHEHKHEHKKQVNSLTDSISCGCGHDHSHEHKHEHKKQVNSLTDSISCGCGHDHSHDHKHAHNLTDNISCGCGCEDGHDHDDKNDDHGHTHGVKSIKASIISLVASITLCVIATQLSGLSAIALFVAAYLIAGKDVLKTAIVNISKGKIFDENFLMTVATIGAFCVGEWAEGVAVMIFYHIGEILQQLAVERSKKNIESLMNIRPDYANVLDNNGNTKTVDPFDVKVGEVLLVKPGEKIPLDGVIVSGITSIDNSMLTGESLPVEAAVGSNVLSGSINLTTSITVKVTNPYESSTVQKILTMVSEASAKKAPTEKFITKFARYYTPIVMAIAALIAVVPPFLLGMGEFSDWFYRGLVFLVVSCPCALVISIPVGFLGGIGSASKHGILVKGGNILEQFENVSTVVFDKTGTLTKGSFSVTEVEVYAQDENVLKEAVLLAEGHSEHPIALCIKKHFDFDNFKLPNDASYENVAGKGVICTTSESKYYAGNKKLMEQINVTAPDFDGIGSVLYIAKDNVLLGRIVVADTIKEDVAENIKALKDLGVKKVFMLTGDNEKTAKYISDQIGLDGYKAQLLPDEKVHSFEEIMDTSEKAVNIFVGDGINDAPLLARSDIGVAMGGIGSDAAIEAADVVLMTDEVKKIAQSIRISKYTKKIVWQNVVFSLGVKFFVMFIAALGYTPMWLAIFADVGVAVLAVLNATRALNYKSK